MSLRILLVTSLVARGALAADLSIPCERGRVDLGSRTIDLLGRCGRPALAVTEREERGTRSRSRDRRTEAERRVTIVIEHWTYDFGPSQFLYLVTLEGGRVSNIEQGPYGTSSAQTRAQAPVIPRARCSPNSFREDESAYELLARCGDPAVRDVREESRTESVRTARAEEDSVTRYLSTEVWTYDLGPKQFIRFVFIEDGRVVRLETGGYGYSQP
jgi:hypothetical protein